MTRVASQYEQALYAVFKGTEIPENPTLRQVNDVTGGLASVDELPMPDELPGIKEHFVDEPITIERPVTASEVFKHLDMATEQTAEIRVQVFDNGVQVLQVGTDEGATMHTSWVPLGLQAAVDLHTHTNGEKLPSITDVGASRWMKGKMLIGSLVGITYIPRYTTGWSAMSNYLKYCSSNQVGNEKAEDINGETYKKFMTEEVGVTFLDRTALDPAATLLGIAGNISDAQES